MEILLDLRIPTGSGSGNVYASSSNVSILPQNAFDDGGNTGDSRWLAYRNDLPVMITYDFETPTEVHEYAIQSQSYRPSQGAPKDWMLQASDDNTTWSDIDVGDSGQVGGGGKPESIMSESFGSYRYYRLIISDNNRDGLVGIGEIEYIHLYR